MLPLEPVDFTSSAPFDPISYYVHIVIGLIGLFAAITAFSARKGGPVHIGAGRVFAVCILIVSVTSIILLSVRTAPPLIVSTAAVTYAMGTALLALRPARKWVMISEIGLALFQIAAVIIFLQFAVDEVMNGTIPLIGPIVILVIPAILLAGDINYFRQYNQRHKLRVRRHLSRMIWAFVIAVRAPLVEVNGTLQLPVPVFFRTADRYPFAHSVGS